MENGPLVACNCERPAFISGSPKAQQIRTGVLFFEKKKRVPDRGTSSRGADKGYPVFPRLERERRCYRQLENGELGPNWLRHLRRRSD